MMPCNVMSAKLDIPADYFLRLKSPAKRVPAPRLTWGVEKEWIKIAKRILAGEYDGADESTRESLMIGLRSWQDPLCQQAMKKLKELK